MGADGGYTMPAFGGDTIRCWRGTLWVLADINPEKSILLSKTGEISLFPNESYNAGSYDLWQDHQRRQSQKGLGDQRFLPDIDFSGFKLKTPK